ncbi:MAG TPA: PAS domain S-box protein, partial [Dehalococcoidia bacterium]|nr:PAS domain S-box protein [Dehalococcoidia bacterium]
VESPPEKLGTGQEAEHQLAQENAMLTRIGRITSATLDIDDVYQQFAQEVKNLVNFDWLAINVIDYQTETFVTKYATGRVRAEQSLKDVVPMAGSMTGAVVKSGRTLVEPDIAGSTNFKGSEGSLGSGIRSVIMVPLTSKGRIIGVFGLGSRQVAAYGAGQQAVLERAANQIAPAVQNAELCTQSRQAEEALLESERLYRDLIERARDVIYTVAPDSTIVSLNPVFETITGWSRQEWIGKSFASLVHPDDLPLVMENFQRSLQGEEFPIYVHRILARSGQYVTGEFLASPRIQDGEVVGVLGIARDVTERKRAEEAIRESEARYRALFEQSKDAIFITRNGRVVDTNQAALDLFGYTRAEAIGLAATEVYANSEDRGRFREEMQRKGSVKDFALHLMKKDGTHLDCLLTATDLRDEAGNPYETQGTIRDVTAQKRAEAALRQSEDRLRRAQQAGRIGTWDWDVIGNQLIWDGVEPIHGLEAGAFDQSFESYLKDIHPDDRDYVQAAISAAARSGSDVGVEYRIIWPDGTLHWVLGTGRAFRDETGKTVRMTGTCQDITQRKEAEETQIQQASELAVLGERNRMAREIHDTLAQGFTGIILQLEAAEQVVDEDPSQVADHLSRARALARESLQEARRTVWGLLPPALEQMPLEDALREEVRKFQAQTQILASFDRRGDLRELPENVQTALLRICQESLNNIKRHAQATRVTVNLTYTGDVVALGIGDNGNGFDSDQVGSSQEGGGFGLKGMRQRAKLLGGTLNVITGQGQGTLVAARIPAAGSVSGI